VTVALDTNILSSILVSELTAPRVKSKLLQLRKHDELLVSAAVYAEILAYPRATEAIIEQFLLSTGIATDFLITEAVWRTAGQRYARYAERRRKSRGGHPKRFLTDFLIGAHALLRCDRLFTLDVERYRTDFPDLEVISI
jgi:predicted nucleic acid-binding protein